MKKALSMVTTLSLALVAQAADPAVGQLPNGTYYLKHEVNFVLEEPVARELSPSDAGRRPVTKSRLLALHPAIRDIVGGHTAAERWLKGEALPERVRAQGPEVPKIARSLKAMLHDGQDAAQVVQELRLHPDVAGASLNRLHTPSLTPADALWNSQWGPQRIRADEAWDVSPASTGVRIAIIDTGVDLTHPDLASRIVYNQGFGGNSSGDAKRDRRGGSSIDHGTHVAGIAAAIRNTNGIAGVARANLMAMGCATFSASANPPQYLICCAAEAIYDAVVNDADVINCSFTMPSLGFLEEEALEFARDSGVVVVVAAGNATNNVDSSSSGSAGWNDHSWPLIVSNTQANDTLNPSSNFGAAIDLAAPGTSILSTATTNFQAASPGGTYTNMSGTSMASPHVAGAVAMVKSMNPNRIGGGGVKDLLYRMAQDLGPSGKDTNYGYGMLQLNPSFLRTLKEADGFVGNNFLAMFAYGTYELPHGSISNAVAGLPSGSTIVLNGGYSVGAAPDTYPPMTISKPCLLTAFPDRPVVIGR